MEYRVIKKVRHYVYDDIEEFNQHNPNESVHKDWRTSNEGDWVYSDDGRIVQLLKVKNEINTQTTEKIINLPRVMYEQWSEHSSTATQLKWTRTFPNTGIVIRFPKQ